MTTHAWKPGVTGIITDPANYIDGTPFVPGDALVVTSGETDAISTTASTGGLATLTQGSFDYESTSSVAPTLVTDDLVLPVGGSIAVTGVGTLEWVDSDTFDNDGAISIGQNGMAGRVIDDIGTAYQSATPVFANAGSLAVGEGSHFVFQPVDAAVGAEFDNLPGANLIITGGTFQATTIYGYQGSSADPTIRNDGTITVSGPSSQAELSGQLSGTGTIAIQGVSGQDPQQTRVVLNAPSTSNVTIGNGELELTRTPFASYSVSLAGKVAFTDANAILRTQGVVDLSAATITGFRAGDRIDLDEIAPATPTLAYDRSTDILTVRDGTNIDQVLHLVGDYTTADFSAATVQYGNDPSEALFGYVEITTDAPCFVRGTLIDTPRGRIPVEALRAGDHVTLAAGGSAPVTWIGRRRVDASLRRDPSSVVPIRIRAGAIGPALPRCDLLVSPDHAVFLDGVLVQAALLVDGEHIVREAPGMVAYVNLELEEHAVILAEGLAVESYLDTGNRAQFANAPLAAAPCGSPGIPCARMVFDGDELEAIRHRLAEARPGHRLVA